jgi:hypothetical protein
VRCSRHARPQRALSAIAKTASASSTAKQVACDEGHAGDGDAVEEVLAARVVALRFDRRFDDEAGVECERVGHQQRRSSIV